MVKKEILVKVAAEIGLPVETVEKVYKGYWRFIKENISALPLHDNEFTEEEFGKLKTNFNIPSLGKLTCTYESFCNTRKRLAYINKVKNSNKVENDSTEEDKTLV